MSEQSKAPARISVFPADPGRNYLDHKDEILEAISRVMESGWYVLGSEVATFEEEFAKFLGAEHAVGVGSGTEALHLALRVLDIGPGDTVITVSHTAVATVAAIELAGANCLFVDIEPDSFTIDPVRLESAIVAAIAGGLPVKAVIPVHLYGHPADMPGIMGIARRHGLAVIEDCAQSHGALSDGKMTGTWGDISAYSFYPTKNLGAMGDGGALVTNTQAHAEKARSLRQYGWRKRYVSEMAGMNTRLDEIQAAILRVKLRSLESANNRRVELAGLYDRLLAATPLALPCRPVSGSHVFHQYVVRLKRRDELRKFLLDNDVSTLIHYPVPIHLQPAYRKSAARSWDLAETERAALEVLSLPLHPGSTHQQVARVSELVVRWCSETDVES